MRGLQPVSPRTTFLCPAHCIIWHADKHGGGGGGVLGDYKEMEDEISELDERKVVTLRQEIMG